MPEFHGRFSSPIAELCAEINDGDAILFVKTRMLKISLQ